MHNMNRKFHNREQYIEMEQLKGYQNLIKYLSSLKPPSSAPVTKTPSIKAFKAP